MCLMTPNKIFCSYIMCCCFFCCKRKKRNKSDKIDIGKYKTIYIDGKYYVFLLDTSDNYIEI